MNEKITSLLLTDPLNNRVVKKLAPPPHRPITKKLLFNRKNQIDWEFLIRFLEKEGKVAKSQFLHIIKLAKQQLKDEPNLIVLSDPVVVVGDIHGQFYDFIHMLEVGGNPKKTQYLFLGDYVDRGSFSIEVLIILFSLKITFPKTVHLLRGNHETRQMTSYFNFKKECSHKYDQEVYNEIMDLFDCLPITALINNRFFCTHGGLSPQLTDIQQINKLQRFAETPTEGILCDFLWADPIENQTNGKLGKFVVKNKARGCSFLFGKQLTQNFLTQNKLLSVIRAHEVQNDGYKFHNWGGKGMFPMVITIFSAPNYCDVYNNTASILVIKDSLFDIKQFEYSSHPYFLPNFMDIFTWSLPFISQKVTQMFSHLLKHEYLELQSQDSQLQNKSILIEQLYDLQHQQKIKNAHLIELGGRLPDDKFIETGLYIVPEEGDHEGTAYITNKYADRQNEMRPQT